MNKLVTTLKETLLANHFQHTTINEVSTNKHLIKINITLPYHTEVEDLEDLLQNLKEEFNANEAKITEKKGKMVTVLFGINDLTQTEFRKEFINNGTLKVTLPTSFGNTYLDFSDDASCHLLIGGTTRTGKSTFLLYMASLLYTQTQSSLYIISSKAKDFYSLNGLPAVRIARFESDLLEILTELIIEYKTRDQYLYSPDLEKATNAKDVLKHYPDKYFLFQPIFLIIDEYARFSESPIIQKLVMELAETAGYVNIHLIIATQRPDARTVISPRIKANLLARVCFTTTDANNSILVLDQEGAEKLGRIKGRAIFLDGETNIIQVPKIDSDSFTDLLKPYKKEIITNENNIIENGKRQENPALTNKIQDMFTQSISENDLQSEFKPNQCLQSSHETPINGWYRLASNEGKG